MELSETHGGTEPDPLVVEPILAFREKPSAEEAAQLGIDTINAGTYVLEPSIF